MACSKALVAAGAVAAAVSGAFAVAATVQAAHGLEPMSAEAGSLWERGSYVAWPRTRSLSLRDAPGSPRVLSTLRTRTRFGSPTSLAVTDLGNGWAEVISTRLPNAARGYVPVGDVHLTHDPIALEVDLSRRSLKVWRMGRLLREVAVAIGAPISPTPIGRFAVTDKLYWFNPAAYGCCILALSAHQTRLAPGWPGGDRLAIHAGDDIGAANSNGCLKAVTSDMRWLMNRVPLGTQIVIHP